MKRGKECDMSPLSDVISDAALFVHGDFISQKTSIESRFQSDRTSAEDRNCGWSVDRHRGPS